MNFFAELKRRHIYRVGAAYAVVAWLLLQFTNNVAPILDLPAWMPRAVLLLLVLGFPIAMLLAWVVEGALKPVKLKGGKHALTPPSNTRVDWVVAGALAVVIGLIAYQQLTPNAPTPTAEKREAGVVAAREAAASARGAISIAVLPFDNLSPDPNQGYFVDGMTEEITTALAKIPDLRIVARESAFAFKGKSQDVRDIGKALNATHLIEGTIRKAGDQLRISAQLVRADTGVALWANSYDRELKDVFAVQEDIARSIAASLHMTLGLKPGENLVNNQKIDPEAYAEYLSIKTKVTAVGNQAGREQGVAELEQLLRRQPDFAPAWAYLAQTPSL